MQLRNAFLATASLFFIASATPMVARSQCNPNSEGMAIRLLNDAYNFVGAPNWPNAWHIQQNGQSPPRYILKDAKNNNRALTRGDNGLGMSTASDSGNDPNQLFDIVCDICLTGVPVHLAADGCLIKTLGNNPMCVSVVSAPPLTEMRTLPCISSAQYQMFEFFKEGWAPPLLV